VLDHPFFFLGRPTRTRAPLTPLLSLPLPLPPGPARQRPRRAPVRNRDAPPARAAPESQSAGTRSGRRPPVRARPHAAPTARPPPISSPPFLPPSGLRSRRAPLLLFSARATVSPRISTPVSYPVHRRACSAGSTHQDLGPSPEFWPPPPLSASRVGKPCLVEFFSNSSRPHPPISLSEL
jgi:hypothetical protein